MVDQYKLTYYDDTGLAEHIRYIFAIAGVEYEDDRIPSNPSNFPFLPPEMKAKYPWGQLPILEYNGKVLAQSNAIARFLARKFNLIGQNAFEAAKCDELCDALYGFLEGFRPMMFEQDPEKKKSLKQVLIDSVIPKYMTKFEHILKENGGERLVGSELTWADLSFGHYIEMITLCSDIDVAQGFPVMAKLVVSIKSLAPIKELIGRTTAAK